MDFGLRNIAAKLLWMIKRNILLESAAFDGVVGDDDVSVQLEKENFNASVVATCEFGFIWL